jgi:hypothetical protein
VQHPPTVRPVGPAPSAGEHKSETSAAALAPRVADPVGEPDYPGPGPDRPGPEGSLRTARLPPGPTPSQAGRAAGPGAGGFKFCRQCGGQA